MNNNTLQYERLRNSFEEKSLPTLETTLFAVTSIIGVIGNGFIFVMVMCRPSMRSARHAFMTNLALNNFLTSASLFPFIYLPGINGVWPYGHYACKVVNAFCGTNVFASAFTIIAIAIDRYSAVRRKYEVTYIDLRKTVGSCLGMWCLAALLTAPIAVYHNEERIEYPLAYFEAQANATIVGQGNITALAVHLCIYKPPFMVKIFLAFMQILFAYVIPFAAVLTLNYQLQKLVTRRRSPGMTSTRTMIANRRRRRQNRRVSVLLLAMAFSYGALWLPTTIMTMLQDFFKKYLESLSDSSLWDVRLMWLAYCSLCVNPILYGYSNQNFKRDLKQTLGSLGAHPVLLIANRVATRSIEMTRVGGSIDRQASEPIVRMSRRMARPLQRFQSNFS